MERVVYVISDPSEDDRAVEIAGRLGQYRFDVEHNGTVGVGSSRIEQATRLLSRGVPVVICATARSLAMEWTHRLARAAHSTPGSRVFVVQMDEGLYVDQLSLSSVVAMYWQDEEQAILSLVGALELCFPASSRSRNDSGAAAEALESDYLDGLTGLTAFSLSALEEYRRLIREDAHDVPPDQLSAWDFMRQLSLMRDGRLTRAGVLMFTAYPADVMPAATVQCVQYFGETRAARQERIDVAGTLPEQILGALNFVETRVRQGEAPVQGSAFAQPAYIYPMVAMREIIANALVHRDYQDATMCVHIRLFTDRVEVTNPGFWLGAGIGSRRSISEFAGESRRRNQRLAHALTLIRLFEGEGSGIPKAVSECLRVGAPQPAVSQADGHVTVTLWPIEPVSQAIDGLTSQEGRTTEFESCEPAKRLAFDRRGDHAWLTWIWPSAIGVASIDWITPTDRETTRVSRTTYVQHGGHPIPIHNGEGIARVTMIAAVDGHEVLSEAREIQLPAPKITVTYSLNRGSILRSSWITIRLICHQDCPAFELILVVAKGQVMPLPTGNAIVVARFAEVSLTAGVPTYLEAKLPPETDKPYWMRCFIPQHSHVVLQDPPVSAMKVG